MPASFHHHFRRHDPTLHGIIRRVGPFRLKPSRDRFGMLVRSIISQQISMGAARAIRARLQQLVGSEAIRPEMMYNKPVNTATQAAWKWRYRLQPFWSGSTNW